MNPVNVAGSIDKTRSFAPIIRVAIEGIGEMRRRRRCSGHDGVENFEINATPILISRLEPAEFRLLGPARKRTQQP